jgi:glutathione peroxidase
MVERSKRMAVWYPLFFRARAGTAASSANVNGDKFAAWEQSPSLACYGDGIMLKPLLLPGVLTLAASIAALATIAPGADAGGAPKSPLDFTVKNIDGKDVPLSKYRGNVVLIVNTASKCGYTPQYATLEKLYEKYKDKGLRILAFPSNDFGHQEPGTEGEIKQFCSLNYKTTFDLFSKVATQGPDQAPLYKFLTSKETNPKFAGPIEWNFNKFLVGRDGQLIARFKSPQDPLSPEVVSAVEAALKQPAPAAK